MRIKKTKKEQVLSYLKEVGLATRKSIMTAARVSQSHIYTKDALLSGELRKIKRNFYCLSSFQPTKHDIVLALCKKSLALYTTAFELHGIIHPDFKREAIYITDKNNQGISVCFFDDVFNVGSFKFKKNIYPLSGYTNKTNFFADDLLPEFPLQCVKEKIFTGLDGENVHRIYVPRMERLLLDLCEYPKRFFLGGKTLWENGIRDVFQAVNFSNFSEALFLEQTSLFKPTTLSRIGFYLETFTGHTFSNTFFHLLELQRSPSLHYLNRDKRSGGKMVARWNILVPENLFDAYQKNKERK